MTALIPAGTPLDRLGLEPIATEMARVYSQNVARIVNAMTTIDQSCEELRRAFAGGDGEGGRYSYDIGFSYRGDRDVRQDKIFEKIKQNSWRILIDRIGVKNVMSMESRKKLDEQIEKDVDSLPEITPESIMDIILNLVQQAESFAQEAVKEAFEFLRSRGKHYKTNKQYRVGKRVILEYGVRSGYGRGGFFSDYGVDPFYRAIGGVMLMLDGKTPLRDGESEISTAIKNAVDGKGESEYFRVKCFKNNNLHLEFKRLDLLRELNRVATGSAEIGEDE